MTSSLTFDDLRRSDGLSWRWRFGVEECREENGVVGTTQGRRTTEALEALRASVCGDRVRFAGRQRSAPEQRS
jgi:hypothetical protein